MRRVGVVDVGSNSVRLVVFDGVARSPAYFYNEKILCGLGRGLQESGRLNPEGRVRAMNAIRRFAALAETMDATVLTGVATAAVRDAEDGAEFCRDVQAMTGLALQVASGEEEALLSAKGVLLGWPQASGLVCDIGGASMELAQVARGEVGARATSPLGPLRLSNLGGAKAIEKAIAKELKKLVAAVEAENTDRIFLVGGSWRAIAKLEMERRGYPLHVLHEYNMSAEQVAETCDWLVEQSVDTLKGMTDSSTARLELVPLAARVLRALVKAVAPVTISVSSYGLREGLLYERMPPSLRARDPLLEAARHMEMSHARFPGFGASLHAWLRPLFPDADRETLRLTRAACYLHDITWRAHPDYRADVCFETVTRANLSGVDHEGRVFLGIAILNRYKGSPEHGLLPALSELLTPERRAQAEELGKAIRLGAMLSGSAPGSLENTALSVDDAAVTLTLRGPARALAGDAVDRRLRALARQRNLEGNVVLEDG
ncbi:Ppx/GppA family phosphatase [Halovulum marinum]|uniref:Ppx/GppA family phosphatase n=1 Tax=Halovulum marinum TaxID=2662447 RepID=UPI002D79DC12|nr:Ppx/GppA family phosphatase [Halovulum marinum]